MSLSLAYSLNVKRPTVPPSRDIPKVHCVTDTSKANTIYSKYINSRFKSLSRHSWRDGEIKEFKPGHIYTLGNTMGLWLNGLGERLQPVIIRFKSGMAL